MFLRKEPGARIVHDPRLTWNTLDIVAALRRQGRAVQVRPRVHQAGDARLRRRLRRRDERAPLFPRLRLCRQRHDPVAAGAAEDQRERQVAVAAGGRAHAPVSGQRRDQSQARPGHRRHEGNAGQDPEALPGQREIHRPHRRTFDGVRQLALQPARLEHRAAGAAQRRIARR